MVYHGYHTFATVISILMMVYVLVWSCLQTFNANPPQNFMRVWMQLILYYAGFTMPWWALLALLFGVLGQISIWLASGLFLLASVYFYCSIWLPSQLDKHEQAIDLGLNKPWRVAVLANLKIGIYGGKSRHILKWIKTVNALDVDAVVITGDWLYYPSADLVGQLMLFKAVNKPIYTVMSRADLAYQSLNLSTQGQPLLEDTLATAFEVLDIKDISQMCLTVNNSLLCGWQEDAAIEITKERQSENPFNLKTHSSVEYAATSKDELIENQRLPSLRKKIAHADLPVIILAGHYDRVYELPATKPRPLMIVADGRSDYCMHGTQNSQVLSSGANRAVNKLDNDTSQAVAPLLSRHPIFSRFQGLHQHQLAQVYVANSVGMSQWPFRITKPKIDVLTIH